MSAPAFGSALMMSSEVVGIGIAGHQEGDEGRAALLLQFGEACVDAGGHFFLPFKISRDLRHVLVAAAGEIDHHQMILRPLRRELHHLGDGVRRFQRRDDAFQPRQQLERRERLVVGRREIGDAAGLVQPGMLRPDAGIIEAGRDRMRVLDLAVVVHQQIGAVAVQHAGPAAGDRGRVQLRQAVAGRFDAEDFDARDRRGTDGTGPSRWSRRRCRRPANPAGGLRPPASARGSRRR